MPKTSDAEKTCPKLLEDLWRSSLKRSSLLELEPDACRLAYGATKSTRTVPNTGAWYLWRVDGPWSTATRI